MSRDALVGNSGDKEQVKGAEAVLKRKHEQQRRDIQWVLSEAAGRRFVLRYLEECGVFRTSFNNSGSITAFNEGQRNVGLMLFSDLNEASPEMYQVMLKEKKGE